MQVGILTTDGGPHPADKWARMTAYMLANNLIEVDEKSATKEASEVREARDDLQQKLYKVLKAPHDKVQTGERAKIAEHGTARLAHPLNEHEQAASEAVAEHVDVDALVEVIAAEANVHPKIFAHFSKEDTKIAVRSRLVRDFSTVMHIERSYHADGKKIVNGLHVDRDDHDPRDPNVLAYRKRLAPGFNADAPPAA